MSRFLRFEYMLYNGKANISKQNIVVLNTDYIVRIIRTNNSFQILLTTGDTITLSEKEFNRIGTYFEDNLVARK